MKKGEAMGALKDFDWKKLCSAWESWHRGESRSPMFNISVIPPAGSVKPPHAYLSMYDFSIPAAEILDEMIAADEAEAAEKAALKAAAKGDTLFQRKYVLPFCISLVS